MRFIYRRKTYTAVHHKAKKYDLEGLHWQLNQ